ncbi:MAG TPA: GNAT family N-acetyltransferase, partial [Lachnospiraceae bacterium]|nr:GNAT family N-acetyltransferase [Lachnospiraceae bacterium]
MIIIEARQKDLEEILQIQHLAFRKEAEDFDDFDIEPMTQTLEVLEEEFKTFLFLKAVNDEERIVGSIRGYIKDGTSYIGKTFVHPDYQGKGIGTEMIKHLEAVNKAARHEINASIR